MVRERGALAWCSSVSSSKGFERRGKQEEAKLEQARMATVGVGTKGFRAFLAIA